MVRLLTAKWRRVDCPTCKMEAQWDCRTKAGKKTTPHAARIKAAEQYYNQVRRIVP